MDEMLKTDNFPPEGTNGSGFEKNKFKDLPDAKPFVLLDENATVIHSNLNFQSYFNIAVGESVFKLKSEPDLSKVFENFKNSGYTQFHADIFIETASEKEPFFVEIYRLKENVSEHFFVTISPPQSKFKIEEKIDNLGQAIEYANISVLITDAEGIVNYASKSFEKFFNKRIEHIYNAYLPDILSDFLSSDDLEELKNHLAIRKKWSKIITDLNEKNQLWFKELQLNPVKAKGENGGFIIVANDITHYVLKTKYIKQSEEKQKSIINNIFDPLLIVRKTDDELYFENINIVFEKLFGLEKNVITDKNIKRYLPGRFYEIIRTQIEALENSDERSVKFSYTFKERSYEGKITFIYDSFHHERVFILILNDITEQLMIQKKLKEAFEKENRLNKLKSVFLANMSHEVRTPLNAIVGYSELLEDDLENNKIDSSIEMIGYMKEGVSRLLHLVDNIVEVSLLESGDQDFDLIKTDLNPLVSETYLDYKNKLQDPGVEILLELTKEKLYVKIDEEKFRKILDVLVDNAIKYNVPDGKIVLRTLKENDFAQIIVSDTGIGIRNEDLDKIVEPFQQVEEESYRRRYEGAGLGLTIANKLTALLNGSMEIKSQLKKGTDVILKFPLLAD